MDVPIRSRNDTPTKSLPTRYARQGRRPPPGPPLRIAFNASGGPKQRARGWDTRAQTFHTYASPGKMKPHHVRQDIEVRAPPSSPRSVDEIWEDGVLRVQIREEHSQSFSSNVTEPIPHEQLLDLLTDSPLESYSRPGPLTPSLFPEPPPLKQFILQPSTPRPKERRPLEESPVQEILTPLEMPAKKAAHDRPTGKRRRLPTAWIKHTLSQAPEPTQPLPTAALPPSVISVPRPPTPTSPSFRIPRKPPPIPKSKPTTKPAALSLFPSSPAGNPPRSSVSPPGSLRSGSTLVGTSDSDATEVPATPTAAVAAQKMATADAYRASCSPGQTSGWYDDDEGIERVGLIGRLRGGKKGGWKRVLCGCFG